MAFHPQPNAKAVVIASAFETAEHEGCLLHIPGALPGETLAVRLLGRHGRQWHARIEQVLGASPHRQSPPCPIWRPDCACPLMIWNADAQADYKRQQVVDALGVPVAPVKRATETLAYRSKVVLVARHGKLGAYRRGSHAFNDLDGCIIEEPAIAGAVAIMRRLLAAVPSFDERDGTGNLRYVVVRASATGDVLVTWIGRAPPPEAQALMQAAPQVKGVYFARNIKPTNAVWDEPPVLLAGAPHIVEHIDGLVFQVSPQSFFQVHREQSARLRADLPLSGRVWDLYCGVGVNALSLAKRGASVHGIESVEAAVIDARANATANGISATFSVGDLEQAELPTEQPDAVVINPPRKGAPKHLLERIAAAHPETIAYIACAPKPLRLAIDTLSDYRVERVQPYDLFPHTEHVETVVIFKRRPKIA